MPKKSKPKRTAIYALLPDETVRHINRVAKMHGIPQWRAIDNFVGSFPSQSNGLLSTPGFRQQQILKSLRK